MKNSKSETSIIKDIAVFDYVAGQQSDGASKNFEQLLEQDADLLQEVATEKQLRSALEQGIDVRNSEPVSMENFNALLERIDNQESGLDDVAINSSFSDSLGHGDTNAVVATPWARQKQFNIAASLAFIAIIGFIGFGQTIKPKFTTLSSQTASTEVDFSGLVEQQRLIKLELADGVVSSDVDELLQDYQIQSIQSDLLGRVVLVSAKQGVDAQQLATWVADARITKAELVSFGAE